MSAVDERSAIGTLFLAGWDEGANPIAWPGREFTPPATGNWARLVIRHADAFQMELGGNRNQYRHVGVVIVQVFTPLNKGDGTALTLAEVAAQVFRDTRRVAAGTDADIVFGTPLVENIGPDEKDAYYQVNVSIPFNRDAVF